MVALLSGSTTNRNSTEYAFGIFMMCIYFRCGTYVVARKKKTIVTLPEYFVIHQVVAQPVHIPSRIVFEKVIISLMTFL